MLIGESKVESEQLVAGQEENQQRCETMTAVFGAAFQAVSQFFEAAQKMGIADQAKAVFLAPPIPEPVAKVVSPEEPSVEASELPMPEPVAEVIPPEETAVEASELPLPEPVAEIIPQEETAVEASELPIPESVAEIVPPEETADSGQQTVAESEEPSVVISVTDESVLS